MKRFNFNLEKILQLRKFKEEECKLALGQAISILNKIENDILQTAVKKHNAVSQRFNNIGDSSSWEVYIKRLEQVAEKLTEKAAKAEIVVEEKRALYLEAQRDLKALEKLREKREEEHRDKMMKLEENERDELTAARRMILA